MTSRRKNPMYTEIAMDEDVRFYLEKIRGTRVLKKDEEAECARLCKAGDKKAKDALIVSNLRFVVAMALKYRKKCRLPLLALVNEGNMGLVVAASKFDPSKGSRFISYAKWWVKYYMLRAITDDYTSGRYRRNDARLRGAVRREGPVPQLLSLDRLISEESDPEKSEHLVDRRSGNAPLEQAVDRNLREIIDEALAKLKPIERDVIVRHFGLNGDRPASMGEIGKSYNLTKERIRQIEGSALKKMKYPLQKRMAFDFF
jgi:RNA polymerase primary sigma factor